MGEAERGDAAPRLYISFFCSNGHETRPAFAAEAQIPEEWDCPRCGLPANRDACHNNIFRDILCDDSTRCNNRTIANLHAFNDHSIGTNKDIIPHTNWLSTCRLNHTCKNSTRTDMRVLTDNRTTT